MHRLKVLTRFARMTAARYGVLAVFSSSVRPRHAAPGHGHRVNPWRRAHDRLSDASNDAMDLVRSLRAERGELVVA